MQKRSVLSSPHLRELKKKRRSRKRNITLLVVFAVVLIITGITLLSRWSKINIAEINITGNKVIETAEIEKVVKEDLNGKYLWLFPKSNFLLFPKSTIEKKMYEGFKRIKAVSFDVSQ